MDPSLSSTELTELFQFFTMEAVDVFMPLKEVRLKSDDKPYITEKIKAEKRCLMREYERHGKTSKYFEIKESIDASIKKEACKYKEKVIEEVKNGSRSSTYKALGRLGVRPGDDSDTSVFQLPNHMSQNFSP